MVATASYFLPISAKTLHMWWIAFLITQAIEIPIYMWMVPRRRWPIQLLIAFGASAITHPFLWFAYPWYMPAPGWLLFFVGEGLVVLVEGMYLRVLGIKNPFLWALLANVVSAGAGEAIRVVWPHLLS